MLLSVPIPIFAAPRPGSVVSVSKPHPMIGIDVGGMILSGVGLLGQQKFDQGGLGRSNSH